MISFLAFKGKRNFHFYFIIGGGFASVYQPGYCGHNKTGKFTTLQLGKLILLIVCILFVYRRYWVVNYSVRNMERNCTSKMIYQKAISNIGTKILYLCCFLTKIMKLFCKWLIFSGSFFKRHVDAYADGVRPLNANFEPKENRFRFASL